MVKDKSKKKNEHSKEHSKEKKQRSDQNGNDQHRQGDGEDKDSLYSVVIGNSFKVMEKIGGG